MTVIHENSSPLAGRTVTVDFGSGPERVAVVDYWDFLTGKSWMDSDSTPAAIDFAIRSGLANLPTDDEVLYTKTSRGGCLVHVSEVR